jgi:uncharacterized protein YkwD
MSRRMSIPLLLIVLSIVVSGCGLVQSVLPITATGSSDEYITYVVRSGDTVSQIASRYGITIEELIALNKGIYPRLANDPSSLQPGWRLVVPKLNSATQSAEDPPRTDLTAVAKIIVDQINAERASRGMVLLKSDVALNRIANDRSTDMIVRNYFMHTDPATGQEPLLRYLQASKYAYQYAGENIAEIKNDAGWVPPWLTVSTRYDASELASEFVKGWLGSAEHRVNIFNTHYQRTGVALAVSPDGRRVVATQVFSD